jgi:hypothetical protein
LLAAERFHRAKMRLAINQEVSASGFGINDFQLRFTRRMKSSGQFFA